MRQDPQRTLICLSEASVGCSARSEGGEPSAFHGSRTRVCRLGAPWLGSTPIARPNHLPSLTYPTHQPNPLEYGALASGRRLVVYVFIPCVRQR